MSVPRKTSGIPADYADKDLAQQIVDAIKGTTYSVGAGATVNIDIQPSSGEVWEVVGIFMDLPAGVAGTRVAAYIWDGTNLIAPYLFDVSDSSPNGKWEGKLYINNSVYIQLLATNADTANPHTLEYFVSAVKVIG